MTDEEKIKETDGAMEAIFNRLNRNQLQFLEMITEIGTTVLSFEEFVSTIEALAEMNPIAKQRREIQYRQRAAEKGEKELSA